MSVSPDLFKQVLGRFCSGVTILTFKNATGIHGLTVTAFSSLSLDPPLILCCIKKGGNSYDGLSGSEHFTVNILSDKQKDLALRFANSELDSSARFAGCEYQTLKHGIPCFNDNLAHILCHKSKEYDGGDHAIFIGQVEEVHFSEAHRPLLYFSKKFHQVYPHVSNK